MRETVRDLINERKELMLQNEVLREKAVQLEEALRRLVYEFEGRWHVGVHGESDVTDIVGDALDARD